MKKTLYIIRDIAITVGIQLVCFMVCLWIQNSTVENALIPAVSFIDVYLTVAYFATVISFYLQVL